jgi:hypothetical protein
MMVPAQRPLPLEPLDAALARQTYLDAWLAAAIAGRFAGAGDLHEVSRAVRAAPPPAGVGGVVRVAGLGAVVERADCCRARNGWGRAFCRTPPG